MVQSPAEQGRAYTGALQGRRYGHPLEAEGRDIRLPRVWLGVETDDAHDFPFLVNRASMERLRLVVIAINALFRCPAGPEHLAA